MAIKGGGEFKELTLLLVAGSATLETVVFTVAAVVTTVVAGVVRDAVAMLAATGEASLAWDSTAVVVTAVGDGVVTTVAVLGEVVATEGFTLRLRDEVVAP